MRQAVEKEAAGKEAAEKEADAKEKKEAENIATTKKKEQAKKLAATKEKEKSEKLAAAKKEKTKKEAASKNKEEEEKEAAVKKEAAEKKKSLKEAAEKKDAGTAQTRTEESEATRVSNTFESPKVQEKIFEKGQESVDKSSKVEPKNKGKRITKPSICEVVFNDDKGTIANRKEIQSLATGITIQKQIIDTFVTVLNYEERIRSGGKDKRRHYFPTNVVTAHLLNKEKDEAKEYVSFENMINNQMNTSESKKKMKDVSYAFFPVVAEGQYYVIVFNLLKANAEILDNEKDCDYNKYQEVFDSVKALFLKYLKKHQHPCVDKLIKEKPTKVLKLKWRTEKNKIDSGLYTMMHMELCQGESTTKWKTDIVEENNRDYLTQMTNMRMRYTTKILMHEMNTKRGLMSEYANKFGEDNKEEEKVKKMVEDDIKKGLQKVHEDG
ncbi:peptidase C48, SUMO/sentrin/Ubl1 [Tanacetum coccineum]